MKLNYFDPIFKLNYFDYFELGTQLSLKNSEVKQKSVNIWGPRLNFGNNGLLSACSF